MLKAPKRFASSNFFIMLFLAIIVALAVMKIAAKVLIPIVVAILLSCVLAPVANLLNKKLKIPYYLCVVLGLLILILIVFVVGTILFSSLRTIFAQYPKYEQRFMSIYETIAEMFDLSFDRDLGLATNLWNQAMVRDFIQNFALSFSAKAINLVKDILMTFLFMLFFMSEFRNLNEKIELAFADILPDKIRNVIANVINQITRYMSVKFYVSLITGVIVYLGCICVHMDFPIVWAFLAFIMNFIPTIGSILSTVLTSLFALLQFWPSMTEFIVILLVMLGVNMIIGNIIEPKIQGENLGLSPFVIIISLSIWGWIWGFVGMILAVPIMVVVKIICENVDMLSPISILLGNYSREKASMEKQNAEKTENENEAETAEEPDFEACCENIENTPNIAAAEKAAVAEANTADAAQNTAEN